MTSTLVCVGRAGSPLEHSSDLTYAYNGDGVLVATTRAGVTTRYTQDLAAPLSQLLSDGSTTYLYSPVGRLASVTGGMRTLG